MKVIRSILAVIAGFVLLSLLAAATSFALRAVAPQTDAALPSLNHLLFTLAYSAVFAFVAGYVAAIIAKGAELGTALALGALLLLLGVVGALASSSSGRDVWFPAANGALQFIAASAGGYFRARQVPAERS